MSRSLVVNYARIRQWTQVYDPVAKTGTVVAQYEVGNKTGGVSTPIPGSERKSGRITYSIVGALTVDALYAALVTAIATQEGLDLLAGDEVQHADI